MSSGAVSVRAPPKPASTVSVPPAAFVSVPVVTVRFATYPASMFVNSISPVFVKPVVTVSAAVPYAPLPRTRSVPGLLTTPPSVTAPCVISSPLFTTGESIDPPTTTSESPAGIVTVPGIVVATRLKRARAVAIV